MIDLNLVGTIAYDWATRCFGVDHVTDPKVRSLRFVEEAIELAQCYNVSKDKLHLLIDTVYAKPHGLPLQEFGGCMITLLVLAEQSGQDLENCTLVELTRILNKSPEHFAERNRNKVTQGLS